MKFSSALFAAILLSAGTLYAAPSKKARIDVGSIQPHKIPLVAGTVKGGTVNNSTSNVTALRSIFPAGNEWKEASFTFNPEKDGPIYIQLRGEWAKTTADRSWIIYDNITVTGTKITNGNFEKGFHCWWKDGGKKAVVIDGGKEGKKAVKVNHDNPLCTRLDVKKDQPVTIKFFFKLAD